MPCHDPRHVHGRCLRRRRRAHRGEVPRWSRLCGRWRVRSPAGEPHVDDQSGPILIPPMAKAWHTAAMGAPCPMRGRRPTASLSWADGLPGRSARHPGPRMSCWLTPVSGRQKLANVAIVRSTGFGAVNRPVHREHRGLRRDDGLAGARLDRPALGALLGDDPTHLTGELRHRRRGRGHRRSRAA